MFNRKCCFEHL